MDERIEISQKGQTLIELVVVIVMVVLVVTALTIATITSLRNSNFAKNQAQATKIAQEGIERVRTGRNQNKRIYGGRGVLGDVNSWNGDSSGNMALWDFQINGTGRCGDDSLSPPVYCYFKVDTNGTLTYLTNGSTFPTSQAEAVDLFSRVVILSDDASSESQKKVTVVVKWKDISGDHESRLTTVLRKI